MNDASFTLPLNDDWRFAPAFSDALLSDEYDGPPLEAVRLPHTVCELPFSYFSEQAYQMLCGYRRQLDVPAEWAGRTLLLRFDAVAHGCEVYLNGRLCGQHACGYTAFTIDISHLVNYGSVNHLCVKVDSRETLNVPPFGGVIDYLTYGGIYREVWLEVRPAAYIADVYAVATAPGGTARLDCQITLGGALPEGGGTSGSVVLNAVLLDADGAVLWQAQPAPAGGDALNTYKISADIPAAALWSCDTPTLYTLRLTLALAGGGGEADGTDTVVGFRTAEFRRDGFYLNGQKQRIRGLNRHQSWAYAGYAMPARPQRLDADILKYELGLNAVRTSHYPQSHHFIARCNEIGLLVFTEFPGWQHIGGDEWKAQGVQNVREMVLQYRNHPSIILWGVRINESPDDDAFYTETNAEAHRLDPSRQTGGVRNFAKSHLFEDVYTYNDFVHTGDNIGTKPKAKVTSDDAKPYMVTEYNGHMYPTKTWDDEPHRTAHALRHAAVLDAVAAQDDVAGSFGWCYADYNTHCQFGSGDHICHHGVMDMFRNPKPAAAVYAAQSDAAPVLEISSSMDLGDHPGGFVPEVWAFTNADAVRMYKDDELIGSFVPKEKYQSLAHPPICINDFIGDQFETKEHLSPSAAKHMKKLAEAVLWHGPDALPLPALLRAGWVIVAKGIPYGKIVPLITKYVTSWGSEASNYRFEAVKDGQVVATVRRGRTQQVRLVATADTATLKEGATYDVASVRMRAEDQDGNLLPYCMQPVALSVSGPVALIGPGIVPLRGGLAGTYLKTTGGAGPATLTLDAGPLGRVELAFTVS